MVLFSLITTVTFFRDFPPKPSITHGFILADHNCNWFFRDFPPKHIAHGFYSLGSQLPHSPEISRQNIQIPRGLGSLFMHIAQLLHSSKISRQKIQISRGLGSLIIIAASVVGTILLWLLICCCRCQAHKNELKKVNNISKRSQKKRIWWWLGGTSDYWPCLPWFEASISATMTLRGGRVHTVLTKTQDRKGNRLGTSRPIFVSHSFLLLFNHQDRWTV